MSIKSSKENEIRTGDDQNENIELPKTLKHKINKLRKIITVEPLVGFYQMGISLSKPALESLEFEKACRVNLGYNDTICSSVLGGNHKNFTLENGKIQVLISKNISWQQPIQSFIPLILILFLGSYSDRHKWRKPFFTIPVLGDLLGNLGCSLCIINMTTWPLEILGIFQRIVPSFFGSQALTTMATTAYIADVSSIESRTFRMGITPIVMGATMFLANLISGLLFVKIGYQGILSLSTILLILTFTYGIFWVKETPTTTNNEDNVSLVADLFNPKHAVDTFRVLFKRSSNLYVMLLLVTLYKAALDGISTLLFRYVQNVFQWTITDYTYFLTAYSIISLIGNILGLCVFVKILRTGDLIILLVAICSNILSNLTFGLAKTSTIFYIGGVIGIGSKLYRIAKRSYTTKIVSTEDIAKTQSLLSIAEALAPVVAIPLYNLIYVQTLNIFPAATIFFSVGLYSICCCLVLWMYCKINRKNKLNIEHSNGQGKYVKTDCEINHM